MAEGKLLVGVDIGASSIKVVQLKESRRALTAPAITEADYKAGRVVSHEQAMEWLGKLAKGERTPRPRS